MQSDAAAVDGVVAVGDGVDDRFVDGAQIVLRDTTVPLTLALQELFYWPTPETLGSPLSKAISSRRSNKFS